MHFRLICAQRRVLCQQNCSTIIVLSGHRNYAQEKPAVQRMPPKNKAVFEQKEAVVVDGFRVMHINRPGSTDLVPIQKEVKRHALSILDDPTKEIAHRWRDMSPTQDWPNVWPTAASFKYTSVPLPLRMGYQKNFNVAPPPDRYGNVELMKIPNFLHLTPKAIQRHCEKLKEFCTEWPKELDSDDKCNKLFPLKLTTTNYVHSGLSLRDERARIACVQVNILSWNLDARSMDKFQRLAGDKYNPRTHVFTITTDRCPTRKQNVEYALYVITALYHVSIKHEQWETAQHTRGDSAQYVWSESEGSKRVINMCRRWMKIKDGVKNADEDKNAPHHVCPPFIQELPANATDEQILQNEHIRKLGNAWEKAMNKYKHTTDDWADYERLLAIVSGMRPYGGKK